jgi:monoamine oxidase
MVFVALLFTLFSNLLLDSSPRIAVIGAGLSGLTAAYRLMQKGYDVIVYEARSRVGGRVFSGIMQSKTGKFSVVEFGAENVNDGGDACNMRTLMQELDLKLIDTACSFGFINYFDGVQVSVPEKELSAYGFNSETLWNYLSQLAQKSYCINDVLHMLFPDNPRLYGLFSLRMSGYEGGPVTKLSATYITTLHRQLLPGINAQENRVGHFLRIDGGNSQLPEALYRRLGGRVRLNEKLCKIEKNIKGAFSLTFNTGYMTEVDSVILTVPCTVYDAIEFGEGVVPEERLSNIKSIAYGENAKIWSSMEVLQADYTFATDRFMARAFTNEECAVWYYRGPYGNFSTETFADVVARDVLIVPFAQGVTMEHMALARDENFAVYTGIVGKSWPLDPYSKGSYSYINAGQEELFTAIETYHGVQLRTLFAPVGKLFFAGEHTTILLDVLGTMEAAVESGERVADIVISECPLG